MRVFKYKFHYTYLITNNNPQSEERYYIGVHSSNTDPETNGYMGSSNYLTEDIKLTGLVNFEKVIISTWQSRKLASEHEIQLHNEYNVAKNKMFYNRANALSSGFGIYCSTPETIQNHIKTKASPEWKQGNGKIAAEKLSKTMLDPSWRATTGKKAKTKEMQTKNDPKWQESVGAECRRKMKEKRNSDEYVLANTFVCQHCNKAITGRSNFNRWHDNNCKLKEEII